MVIIIIQKFEKGLKEGKESLSCLQAKDKLDL